MTLDDPIVLRAAGVSALVAIIAIIVAGIAFALFIGGAGAFWGPINDVSTSVALLALLLPVIAVQRLAAPGTGIWLDLVTVAAIAGIILAAVGQLLLVAGVIPLQTSFVTGGLGVVPLFVWLVSVAILAIGAGVLPSHIGWLAIGVIVLSAGLAMLSGVTTGPAVWVAAIALLAVLVGWMGSLGWTLMERGATTA
jgi:hypothetical protein